MRFFFVFMISGLSVSMLSCSGYQQTPGPGKLNTEEKLQAVHLTARFIDVTSNIRSGKLIGTHAVNEYHLLYSPWPGKYGIQALGEPGLRLLSSIFGDTSVLPVEMGELRGMHAYWDTSTGVSALRLEVFKADNYAWATLSAPKKEWNFMRYARVEADIANRGTLPVEVLFWSVGDRGWDAAGDFAILTPGEERKFSCNLQETFPDGTPKIDPGHIKKIQAMTFKAANDAKLEVKNLTVTGRASGWSRPAGRLNVPEIKEGSPRAGHCVRYRRKGDENSHIYSLIYLPVDWKKGVLFPVIVEYPGNIFFSKDCYSTGLPDQCVIGYGMSKGMGAIWVSLPFVDRKTGTIVENGWGDPDATADYAVSMVADICAYFGGDPGNVILTGFSRGAIACGYIGLRNDRIAPIWKAFHACQHYDGDGWNGATMNSAMQRARRFAGKAVFQTDNSAEFFQPLMDEMKAKTTYVSSGLGFHSCAMFLDDRPSTQQLRGWFKALVTD